MFIYMYIQGIYAAVGAWTQGRDYPDLYQPSTETINDGMCVQPTTHPPVQARDRRSESL
jgi:hypothetical protein